MYKIISLLLIALMLISCKRQPLTQKEMIIGTWKILQLPSKKNEYTHRDLRGYEFLKNNACEYKMGYHDYESKNPDYTPFFGTSSTYKLDKDSLKVFNPAIKKWDAFKINILKEDTLSLTGRWYAQKENLIFIKEKHQEVEETDFDEVLVSCTACLGSCPENDIRISNNGNIIYYGYMGNMKNGVYTSKISKDGYSKIAYKFQNANFSKLSNEYYSSVTDNSSTSVTFLKDGKIIKTVDDYAFSSPLEFIWAYSPLKYISQQLTLVPKKNREYFVFSFASFKNEKKEQHLNLIDSEKFFLMNSLESGTETNKHFNELYALDVYGSKTDFTITTDGRYYKFYFKNNAARTFDIGYNFITENKLVNNFMKN